MPIQRPPGLEKPGLTSALAIGPYSLGGWGGWEGKGAERTGSAGADRKRNLISSLAAPF